MPHREHRSLSLLITRIAGVAQRVSNLRAVHGSEHLECKSQPCWMRRCSCACPGFKRWIRDDHNHSMCLLAAVHPGSQHVDRLSTQTTFLVSLDRKQPTCMRSMHCTGGPTNGPAHGSTMCSAASTTLSLTAICPGLCIDNATFKSHSCV
jgi:hypothetical protein